MSQSNLDEQENQQYQAIRPVIETGDLLFWTGTCFYCRVVRTFTNSTFSHAGVAWVVNNRVFVLDAAPPAVRIIPLSRKLPVHIMKTGIKLSDDAINFALSKIGDPYSKWSAIKAYFNIPLKTDSSWECVEYVHSIYKESGIIMNIDLTPQSLLKWGMKNGYKLEYVDR